MKERIRAFLVALGLMVGVLVVAWFARQWISRQPPISNPLNIVYVIDRQNRVFLNGQSEMPAVHGSVATVKTLVLGAPVSGGMHEGGAQNAVGAFQQNSASGLAAPLFVLQGDTGMLTISGANNVSDVSSVTFDNKKVPVFLYQNKPTVLLGMDLNQKLGGYPFVAKLKNTRRFEQLITVVAREKPKEELGIPQKLGGNTPASQTALVNSLVSENAVLNKLYTGYKAFWTLPFGYPVKNARVTDPYGYIRQTGSYFIAHKGADFHAENGTPVLAMNRGVVRLARTFRTYGKTVVVDHGLGIMTFYMHLSKIKVNGGELVKQGQVVGLSGQSGYAEASHLHISVRVGGVSVDPVQFLHLFGK